MQNDVFVYSIVMGVMQQELPFTRIEPRIAVRSDLVDAVYFLLRPIELLLLINNYPVSIFAASLPEPPRHCMHNKLKSNCIRRHEPWIGRAEIQIQRSCDPKPESVNQ